MKAKKMTSTQIHARSPAAHGQMIEVAQADTAATQNMSTPG
ncbi:hypothetical protein ABTZ57_39685 [Streptomyces sp. NPDC094048]